MKKYFSILLTCILVLLMACSDVFVSANYDSSIKEPINIGIAFPDKSLKRWEKEGNNLKSQFEALGYNVILKYASGDVYKQAEQIENLIDKKVNCLIVAPCDSSVLESIDIKAKEANIPIIAYDSLLMNIDAVSYYIAYDSEKIGSMIGMYIKDMFALDSPARTYTIELFMGPINDNNALMIYNGCMEILKPYFDNGTLLCKSGNIVFNDVSISNWDKKEAKKRCVTYLNSFYSDEKLDICCSACDDFSFACKSAFEDAGYNVGSDWPLITGKNADVMAIKNIIEGSQAMSIFKDTRILTNKCVDMVNAVVRGRSPKVNNKKKYNNGKKIVPSYLLEPVVVDIDNYYKVLVDSGYYTEEELK